MVKSPAIIGGTAPKGSALFRARDVRANIKEMGFEKGTELSLTIMADEMTGMRQVITELTSTVQQCINLLSIMTQVNGAMATKINNMSRSEQQYEEARREGGLPSDNGS